MFADASDSCNQLNFQLGPTAIGTTIATRSWSIKVIFKYSSEYTVYTSAVSNSSFSFKTFLGDSNFLLWCQLSSARVHPILLWQHLRYTQLLQLRKLCSAGRPKTAYLYQVKFMYNRNQYFSVSFYSSVDKNTFLSEIYIFFNLY